MNVSMLIAEDGAQWVDRAQAWRMPANEFMVLAQQRDESHRDFRTRVEQRLERIVAPGRVLEQVLLVAGSRRDETALLARAQMMCLLLRKPSGRAAEPSVLLDSGADDDVPAERCIRALAEAVVEQLGATLRLQTLSSMGAS